MMGNIIKKVIVYVLETIAVISAESESTLILYAPERPSESEMAKLTHNVPAWDSTGRNN